MLLTYTRGHPLKLFYSDPRVNARAHCFPIGVISLWNRLPASLMSAENIHVFKKLLRHVGTFLTRCLEMPDIDINA